MGTRGVGYAASEAGCRRRHIDEQSIRAHILDNALRAEIDFFDIAWVADHGDDNVGSTRDRGWRVDPLGSQRNDLVGTRSGSVEHNHGITGIMDVARHAASHYAETDESDIWQFGHSCFDRLGRKYFGSRIYHWFVQMTRIRSGDEVFGTSSTFTLIPFLTVSVTMQ